MSSLVPTLFNNLNRFGSFPAIEVIESTGLRILSFAELNELALRVAGRLVREGAQGRPVAVLATRSFSAYCGVLGSLYAGCFFVPLNPKLSDERLRELLCWIDPAAIISSPENLARAGELFGGLVLSPESCDQLPLSEPLSRSPTDPAYVVFTSGSTGAPKGIEIRDHNLEAYLKAVDTFYDLEPGARMSQAFDLSFDPAIGDIFLSWKKGATLCALPDSAIYRVPAFVREKKIVFWNSAPILIKFALQSRSLAAVSMPGLRYSAFIGEKLHYDLAAAWRKAAPDSTIENIYGPAEATISVSRYVWYPNEEPSVHEGGLSIGRVHTGQHFRIVNESMSPVAQGERGELCLSGGQVASGYWKQPELTERAFVELPDAPSTSETKWYRTGDLVHLDREANLQYGGRTDWQIKIGSQRLEPGEIEGLFSRFSGVQDVVVLAWPLDSFGDPAGTIALVSGSSGERDWEQVIQELRKRLPAVAIPSMVLQVSSYPATLHGKVDRKRLIEIVREGCCPVLFPNSVKHYI